MSESIGTLLNDALAQYRANDPENLYDEVLQKVSERATEQKCLNKADIGSLVLWKRISAQTQWASALGMTPDRDVREATREAWRILHRTGEASPDAAQAAREAIRPLPGLGGAAIASAVLLVLAPDRMAVWDRRVKEALLAIDGRIPNPRDFFRGYLTRFLELVDDMQAAGAQAPVIPRHVDLALWQIGGFHGLLDRARAQPGKP